MNNPMHQSIDDKLRNERWRPYVNNPMHQSIDDKLRNELIKSSEDYMVFPTNLYARYLLNITYSTLGQVDNLRNNMTELTVLRERYSQFHEFAPMLKIMSTIVIC